MPPARSQSPPKRMTRSRAKAVEEKQQTKVITTPGAKAAAPKTTKRKARAEDAPNAGDVQQDVAAPSEAKQPAYSQPTRATRGKAKISEPEPAAQKEATTSAPKPRGRPRAAVVKKDEESSAATAAAPIATRTTRGKAAAQKQPPAPRAKAPAKKVTFQDDEEAEKENLVRDRPTSKDGKDVVVEKGTAAMTKAPRKGRPASAKPGTDSAGASKKASEKARAEPLSPKKPTQVAKGNGNEEAPPMTSAPPQSPVKLLSQSPQKQALTPKKSPVKAADAGRTETPSPIDELQLPTSGSPLKQSAIALGGSPPKRPPPSPTKASMKDSPKKLDIGTPAFKPTSSVVVEEKATSSLAQTPARRPPSPIKLFQKQSSTKPLQTPGSTMKTSLLQSPAKHAPSGIKPFNFGTHTPGRPNETPSMKPAVSVLRQSPQKFKMPFAHSPSKSSKPETVSAAAPQQPPATAEQHKEILMDELMNAPAPFTPGPQPKPNAEIFSDEPAVTTPDTRHTERKQLVAADSNPFQHDDTASYDSTVEVNIFEDTLMPQVETETPTADPVAAFEVQASPSQWSPTNDSEDELMSDDPKYDASPSRRITTMGPATASKDADFSLATPTSKKTVTNTSISMTGLAERFGGWVGATPDPNVLEQRRQDRFVFSPVKAQATQIATPPIEVESPHAQIHSFDEAIEIHEDDTEMPPSDQQIAEDVFRQSKVSDASQDYGDENGTPVDPTVNVNIPHVIETCTPQRLQKQEPRIIHTVSKVPLKPAADDEMTPDTKANIKKRRSVANALTPRADLELQALRQIYPMSTADAGSSQNDVTTSADETHEDITPTMESPTWSLIASPARTPRSNVDAKLLNGAVVFVDVHTSEGADASGIFVDLLQQMGATVRSSWNWNASSFEDIPCANAESKVGITHVVFKDGGKRTMEKVRMAKGVVTCVGVGWVLDCERENKWLDEAGYAIDTSFVPRGGHRRRKSMEPKLLSNLNGTLSTANTPRKSSPQSSSHRRVTIAVPPSPDMSKGSTSPQAEFVADEPMTFYQDNEEDELAAPESPASFTMPETPARPYMLTGGANSPTTPYFLHPTQIVQQTCPPKQSQQSLFPLSGRIQDQPDESLRKRLMDARRKSLQFAPKVKSPLANDFE